MISTWLPWLPYQRVSLRKKSYQASEANCREGKAVEASFNRIWKGKNPLVTSVDNLTSVSSDFERERRLIVVPSTRTFREKKVQQ